MHDMMPKVKALRDAVEKDGLDVEIEVVGGINKETVKEAAKAGADVFVAGSSVFAAEDAEKAISEIRDAAKSF